jgi:hypothetical protein
VKEDVVIYHARFVHDYNLDKKNNAPPIIVSTLVAEWTIEIRVTARKSQKNTSVVCCQFIENPLGWHVPSDAEWDTLQNWSINLWA